MNDVKGVCLSVPGMRPGTAAKLATKQAKMTVRDKLGVIDHLEAAGGVMPKRDLRRRQRRFHGEYSTRSSGRWAIEYSRMIELGAIIESGTGKRGDPVIARLNPKMIEESGLPMATELDR